MHCILPTMRAVRLKFFISAMVLLATYMFLWFLYINGLIKEHKQYNSHFPKISSLNLPYVVVHIDLKGAPPRLEYLESLLPTLKENGVNGLLMEYEDMFPYEGMLLNISSANCYSRSKLRSFLSKAAASGFEVMPLIQTFGHLEYVLGLQEFRHLRENQKFPDSICPSKKESRDLIGNMLEQVIIFHSDIRPLKYFHFGCDEVFHINTCKECVARNGSNIDVFLQHVQFLSDHLHEKSPATTALIWDDVLRSTNSRPFNINWNNVQIVYWDYQAKLDVTHINLLKYHRSFRNTWIASAYKGADGVAATFPNINVRFMNHFSWMNLILNYRFGGEDDVHSFGGIILTGWSRYSHLDPLCELLPVSLPSLLLNLIVIERYRKGILHNDIHMIADRFFDRYIDLKCMSSPLSYENINSGNFTLLDFDSETKLSNVLKLYEKIKADVGGDFSGTNGILSAVEYASKKLLNRDITKQISRCNETLNKISNIETSLVDAMKHFYEYYVIDEYVNLKTYSLKTKLNKTLQLLIAYESTEAGDVNLVTLKPSTS